MSVAETSPGKTEAPNPRVLYERSTPLTRELLMQFCYFDHRTATVILHRGTAQAINFLHLRGISVKFLLANGLDDISLLEGKVLRVSIEDAPSTLTSEETSGS